MPGGEKKGLPKGRPAEVSGSGRKFRSEEALGLCIHQPGLKKEGERAVEKDGCLLPLFLPYTGRRRFVSDKY